MRRYASVPLVLLWAAAIHADWHFARPLHHRLSLDLEYHWLFCAGVFALAGAYVARRWPDRRWLAGAWNLGLALVVAQVVEPLLEVAYYDHVLAYDVEPARWAAFGECLAAGIPAFLAALALVRRRPVATAPAT